MPKGKLIRLRAQMEDGKVRSVKITGDFFLHPEEKIVELEGVLAGKELDRVTLQEAVESVLKDCEPVGFSSGDMADALMKLQSASR